MTISGKEKAPGISHEPQHDKFSFRPATPEDAETIILIAEQAQAARRGEVVPDQISPQPERIKKNRELLSKPATWSRLALVQDEPIGFVLGYPLTEEQKIEFAPATEHLAYLMINPGYWREGLGSSLLDWAILELREQGVKAVNLWTEINNTRSRPLYERKGFRTTGKERIHSETQEHQVEYLLEITK